MAPCSLSIEPLEDRIVLSASPMGDGEELVTGSQDPSPQAAMEAGDEVDLVAFAQALAAADATFYGAAWCPHCTEQKALFEDGAQFLPFVEVTNPDMTPNQIAIDESITTYPTWERADGERITGLQTLAELSAFTGVEIPMSSSPFVAPIDDQTVLGGSPLHLALDGYDPNGGPLTYTVEISNSTVDLEATILDGNRTLSFDMGSYGRVSFEVFEQRVPEITETMLAIADSGVWEDTIFHRIVNGFVIQGGDPTGTGGGDPSLLDFDDQFHEDLQHNVTGMLSMAKAGDDTNSSQFFITEGPTRHLDGNHSVWGIMTEGEAVREAVSNVPTPRTETGANDDKPLTDVTLHNVDVSFDEENAVVMFKAPEGASGTADVTVTVTDENGNEYVETFSVTVAPDTSNTGPWLVDTPAQVFTTPGVAVEIDLAAFDIEGDDVFFDMAPHATATIDNDTGVITVTPGTLFTGDIELLVGVRPVTSSNTSDTFDTQTIIVTVIDPSAAPSGIDLLAASDAGSSSSDNVTNLTTLELEVSGVADGATVTLFSGTTEIGSAVASGSTVVVTADVSSLGDQVHSITARQSVGSVQSPLSSPLEVEVDTTFGAFTSSPITTIPAGDVYTYNVSHEEEGDTGFVYSLSTAPTGMTINPDTGALAWTTTGADSGSNSVVVTATDLAGNTDTHAFSVDVTNGAPVLDPIADQTVDEGDTLTIDADATDPNGSGDTLTYSLDTDIPVPPSSSTNNGPNSANVELDTQPSIDPATGEITWTPAENHGGQTFQFIVTVEDLSGAFDLLGFNVTVGEVNLAPVLNAISDVTISDGEALNISAVANDEDLPEQDLTYSLSGVSDGATADPPAGATIDPDTGQFSWTPSSVQANSSYTITIRATDPEGLFDEQTFTVNVQDASAAPILEDVATQTVLEGDEVVLTITASDANLPIDTLNFLLIDAPTGATLVKQTATTAEFRWQTSETDGPADHNVTIRVTDSTTPTLADQISFTISVTEDNQAPVLDPIAPQSATEGDEFSLTITATDPDLPAQQLVYSLPTTSEGATVNPPAGAAITPGGDFTWTPDAGHVGATHMILVRVSDGTDTHDLTLSISVDAAQKAPVLQEISDRTVDEGETVILTAIATDSNNDDLTFSLTNAPAGATIDPDSGEFQWQTGEADGPGEHSVTVRVEDTTGRSDQWTFSITVGEVNQRPVVEPVPDQTVNAGETLRVQIVATDADFPEQTLDYSLHLAAFQKHVAVLDCNDALCGYVEINPDGSQIDSATGEIEWDVPVDISEGRYGFSVRVSDSSGNMATEDILFVVNVSSRQDAAAVADQLARRAAAPQQVIAPPVVQNVTPVFIPALVNQPFVPAEQTSQVAEALRVNANIGSGVGPSSDSDDSKTDDSEVVPATHLELDDSNDGDDLDDNKTSALGGRGTGGDQETASLETTGHDSEEDSEASSVFEQAFAELASGDYSGN